MNFSNAGLGKFLNKQDIKDDMYFKIISPEPSVKESDRFKDKNGNPTKQYIWQVWNAGNISSCPFNWTSIKAITEMYGGDSPDWVGKWVVSKNNFDMAKKKNFLYFFPVEKSMNIELDKQYKASISPEQAAKPTVDSIQFDE
jgi:hypothetical protein